jgi:DNA-binding helix-hairpin-helix protein with protein kinase domain
MYTTFAGCPTTGAAKKNDEEELFNEELNSFLSRYYISEHTIPSFGPTKKNALLANGIVTATDVLRLQHIKVPGIGPANIELLKSWRRQMANDFVYIPNDYAIIARMRLVDNDVLKLRGNLEHAIRKEHLSLNYIKQNISNRALVMERQLPISPPWYTRRKWT